MTDQLPPNFAFKIPGLSEELSLEDVSALGDALGNEWVEAAKRKIELLDCDPVAVSGLMSRAIIHPMAGLFIIIASCAPSRAEAERAFTSILSSATAQVLKSVPTE